MVWQSAPELTSSYLLQMALALICGAGLGLFYYGGLWWTVRRLQTAQQPGLLFATSFLVRDGIYMLVALLTIAAAVSLPVALIS